LRHEVENPPEGAGWDIGDYTTYLQKQLPAGQPEEMRTVKSLEEATRNFRNNPQNAASDLFIPYRFPVPKSPGDRLSIILAGDNFEDVEKTMSGLGANLQTSALNRDVFGMLFHAIWRSAFERGDKVDKRPSAEIIVIDLAPSFGSVNMNLLMHSDYFLAPCLADQFSQKALERLTSCFEKEYRTYLGSKLVGTVSGLRSISRGIDAVDTDLKPFRFPLPSMQPQFAGCIISNYSANPVSRLTLIPVKRGLDADGNPKVDHCHIEDAEGYSAKRLTSFIMRRADELAAHLQSPSLSGNVENGTFAVPATSFPPAHVQGSNFYPQPHTAARLRKMVPGLEHATSEVGVPPAFLTNAHLKELGRDLPSNWEAVAHFQRIYIDLAKWIIGLPLNASSPKFDFNIPTFDPSQGAQGLLIFNPRPGGGAGEVDSSGLFPRGVVSGAAGGGGAMGGR